MKPFSPKSTMRLAAAIFLFMGLHAQPWAQGVFKCSASGKTVYQAIPCEGKGKELVIPAGPTEQEIKEAKMRADADKARAAGGQAPSAQRPEDRQMVGNKVDCAKLNKERADAFGRRNNTIRESRSTNINQSSVVDKDNNDIRRIESQMVKGGCQPT
jgi:hypothetical protein